MVEVKILGISCSPRHGNTEIMVKEVLKSAEELPGVETEFWSVVGKKINFCIGDLRCANAPKDKPCQAFRDDMDELIPKMLEADGLIIGSPVYWSTISGQFAVIKDRLTCVEQSQLGPMGLRNKVVGVVTQGYDFHGGQEFVISNIIRWAMQCDMIPIGCGPERPSYGLAGYWGACGSEVGHPETPDFPPDFKWNSKEERSLIERDKSAMVTARLLAKRVTEMAKVIKAGFENVPREELHWPKGPAGGYPWQHL